MFDLCTRLAQWAKWLTSPMGDVAALCQWLATRVNQIHKLQLPWFKCLGRGQPQRFKWCSQEGGGEGPTKSADRHVLTKCDPKWMFSVAQKLPQRLAKKSQWKCWSLCNKGFCRDMKWKFVLQPAYARSMWFFVCVYCLIHVEAWIHRNCGTNYTSFDFCSRTARPKDGPIGYLSPSNQIPKPQIRCQQISLNKQELSFFFARQPVFLVQSENQGRYEIKSQIFVVLFPLPDF